MKWEHVIDSEDVVEFEKTCYKLAKKLFDDDVPYEVVFTALHKLVTLTIYDLEIDKVLGENENG